MAFRKYQKVERQEVLSKDNHKRIGSFLKRFGKTSASELTDEQREELQKQLAK